MNDDKSSSTPIATWAICGAVLLIPPFTVAGIGVLVLAFVAWLFSGVIDRQEQAMIDVTEQTGDGCGAFMATALLIIAVCALGLVLAFVAMEGAMVNGL